MQDWLAQSHLCILAFYGWKVCCAKAMLLATSISGLYRNQCILNAQSNLTSFADFVFLPLVIGAVAVAGDAR
jgi:hypothetical protein